MGSFVGVGVGGVDDEILFPMGDVRRQEIEKGDPLGDSQISERPVRILHRVRIQLIEKREDDHGEPAAAPLDEAPEIDQPGRLSRPDRP